MSKQIARIVVTISFLLFAIVAKASYCSSNASERIFHVYANPSFRILSNNEPQNMGFEDTCDQSSCFFHTCNDGTLTIVIGTTSWSKYCTMKITAYTNPHHIDGFYARMTGYTCTIDGKDAGDKMKVTQIESTGGNYYKFSITE